MKELLMIFAIDIWENQNPLIKLLNGWTKKILLPHPKNNQLKRALLQAGNKIKNSLESSFQLWGNGIVINIKKTADNKFLINRVERARQPKDINEQRPMIILEADIYFCDASIAGSLRGNIQTELDDIVKNLIATSLYGRNIII